MNPQTDSSKINTEVSSLFNNSELQFGEPLPQSTHLSLLNIPLLEWLSPFGHRSKTYRVVKAISGFDECASEITYSSQGATILSPVKNCSTS
jgi:hypothetical protein